MVYISENRSYTFVQTVSQHSLLGRVAIETILARKDNIAAPMGAEFSARTYAETALPRCLGLRAGLVVLRGVRLHIIYCGSGTIAFREGRD